jgi:glutamate-1-semialdehyde 2,1-aminomutase
MATMSTHQPTNAEYAERAERVIPGGVSSPVRAFGSVGGTPRFFVSGSGARVVDVEGQEYIDLVGAWGPALLGHADPRVIAAVHEAVDRGLGFGASAPAEVELAELLVERLPEVDKIRMVSTGTEATMTAIRIARGATNRPLIVKFAGHYHGHSDGLLAAAGSGLATLSLPGSAGVTPENAAQTIVLPYNDEDALEAVFNERGSQIAAVIAEAAAANMGVLPPKPGFTQRMLEIAHKHGALVILDEVLTGFRAGPTGYWGIERASVIPTQRPDLFTYGKVVGGGLPMAAVGGRADLMDLLAPMGPVYQAGTLSGHPIAATAGLATLRAADPAVYQRLGAAADSLVAAIAEALTHAGVPHRIQRAGTLFSVLFGDFPESPSNYDQMLLQDTAAYGRFFHSMLSSGISLPPSAFEAWFVSASHDEATIAQIADALPHAAKSAAQADSA